MLRSLFPLADRLAARAGVKLVRDGRWKAMQGERCALLDLLRRRTAEPPGSDFPAACVIFSKDRPVQLAATLGSLRDLVRPLPPTQVLYRASHAGFEASYREVFEAFFGFVSPVPETDFRTDLIAVLGRVAERRTFFLVDDIVFTEPVDLGLLAGLEPEEWVPSLRLGRNLRRCYTSNRAQPLPPLSPAGCAPGLLSWRWGDGVLDWGYPLSVDGNLFSTREIACLAEVTQYRAPNSFEVALQHFSPCFSDRRGACYEKSRLVNIPCNKVQEENDNRAGVVTPEALLETWRDGKAIDYRRLYGFRNTSAHEELPFAFADRVDLGLPDPRRVRP